MIYLYALCHPEPSAVLQMLDGQDGVTGPIRATRVKDTTLLWGECEEEEFLPRRRLLLRHAKVLEVAMRAGPLLPMRFGMTAPDLGEATQAVEGAQEGILSEIGRIGNREEFGLRIEVDEEAALGAIMQEHPDLAVERDNLNRNAASPHAARIAFGQKLGERLGARRSETQRTLVAALKEECDSYIIKAPELDTEVLRAEFLLPSGNEETFARAVEDAVEACPFAANAQPRIRILGPSPAYNFVNLELETLPQARH